MKLKTEHMLNNINWTQYLTALIILLTIYYGYVLKRFYSADILKLLDRKASEVPVIFSTELNNNELPSPTAVEEKINTADILEEIEDLTDRVKSVIISSAHNRGDFPTLIATLKIIVNDYPSIKASEFRPAINELILAECEKTGFIRLNEEDVNGLWDV